MNPESTPALEGRKHTPVPWSAIGSTICCDSMHSDKFGDNIASCCYRTKTDQHLANAAFIVTACNQHAALLARNAELVESLAECCAGFAVAIASHGLNPDDN